MAIDPADKGNGGLVVVPETQHLDIECPDEANPALSYFKDEVHVPEGKTIVPANLTPGDVLFFNGSTIHGSLPNDSKDRFRRSFICHYVGASVERTGRQEMFNYLGEPVSREINDDAGPCGTPYEVAPH